MVGAVANVLIAATAFLAVLFVVLFALWERDWWRTEMGRHIMAYSIVVAGILLLSMVRLIAGVAVDKWWFAWLRLGVFAGMPVVIGWRTLILWRLHRTDRQREDTDCS